MPLCSPCVIMGYFELATKRDVGDPYCSIIKPQAPGDTQWLRLCPSTLEGLSTIPDHPGTRGSQKTKTTAPLLSPPLPHQLSTLLYQMELTLD